MCKYIYCTQLATNILNMDASIISMGHGIMGTGTSFGFSGLELGFYLDFCHSKSAQALFVPRISLKMSAVVIMELVTILSICLKNWL